jgi:hypothetical protein
MFKVDTDQSNKYLYGPEPLTIDKCYEICGEWSDWQAAPRVLTYSHHVILSDHHLPGGTKFRWGDLLVRRWSDAGVRELVYVAPRQGYAAIALAYLADRYGMKLTLFMPACKEVSDHQALAIELGAVPIFHRVAAMPNLNRIAAAYADQHDRARFVPFGLDHKLVVAAGVVSTRQRYPYLRDWFDVDQVATVVSTGVLTRTLQIAWPDMDFLGVAVGRNMHDGECGKAWMTSYDKPFTTPSRLKTCPVPGMTTERCYDMKGLEVLCDVDRPSLFWNVAGEAPKPTIDKSKIDSQRDW